MLTRWNPFNELWGFDDSGYSSQLGLACDVFDDENAVMLKAEMPGIKPEDVKVDVHGNTLTISGERNLEQEKNVRGYRHIERRYGSFSRSFSLPDTIDADSIEATLDAGILTVRLPKSARARPRSISVGRTAGRAFSANCRGCCQRPSGSDRPKGS